MNKDNFKKLIDAILFDGQVRFNMACFVGKLIFNDQEDKELVKNGQSLASNYRVDSLGYVETTELFNCDSVGCIAGFSAALANDWKTPKWLTFEYQNKIAEKSPYNVIQDFELTSNSFLGLTSCQGKKLYYADNDSVWKYLRYFESDRYLNLQYSGEEDGEAEDIVEKFCDWDDDCFEVDFSSIDYKTAADVLTRIMNEEIILGDNYGGITINIPTMVGE
jgi:hypothetical protein